MDKGRDDIRIDRIHTRIYTYICIHNTHTHTHTHIYIYTLRDYLLLLLN